jgi:cytochrome c oxidase cbb3-type subunit 3
MAGTVTALALTLVLTTAHRGAAQSDASQFSAGSSDFLKVPLVKNIPGAIAPPPSIANPTAKDPAAAERGMQYFVKFNCVGCHAPNGAGGMGPSLSNAAFKFGSDPDQLFVVISHGAPQGMPAWGSVLPQQVIWDLVAYIKSISKAPKPEWGQTVSVAAHAPGIEQVPAEFKETATPWQFTEPFASGRAPPESAAASGGSAPPASTGSSKP